MGSGSGSVGTEVAVVNVALVQVRVAGSVLLKPILVRLVRG